MPKPPRYRRAACPVLDRPVGCQQGAGALIAAHADLQEVLGGCRGSLRMPTSSLIKSGDFASSSIRSFLVESWLLSASSMAVSPRRPAAPVVW
jgi:hypothetical protein